MRRLNAIQLIEIIFGIIGVLFLTITIVIDFLVFIPREDRVKVTGTIVDIKNDNEVFVSYLVGEKHYTNKLDSYSSSYYQGKEIAIYYDQNNPNRIMSDLSFVLIYVFGGLGIGFLTVTGIMVFFSIRKQQIRKKLIETGHVVQASVSSIEMNQNYSVNGKHPYVVVCEWNSMDNKRYLFKSDNIWFNPTKTIEERGIKTFPVYLYPYKMKPYYMDISELLKDIIDLR